MEQLLQNLITITLLFTSVSCSMTPSDNCTEMKTNFATAVSDFTLCAINYSRPITLCESCVDSYINVLDSYHNLSQAPFEDHHCIDEYVNLDRLQIVETLYRNSYDLWNRAKCYECFEIVNNSLSHNRSKETEKFNDLLNQTRTCINSTGNDESLYCYLCIDPYLELNSYYISISNINEKIGVCMDIVDLMNGTRLMWSEKCCEYRKKHDYIFLGSTAAVTFMTVLFYLLAKFCTDIKKSEIFQQSRLAGSLNNIPGSSQQSF